MRNSKNSNTYGSNEKNSLTCKYVNGFDYLRCLAMAFVLFQHQLSVLNLERYTSFKSINIGQLGVAIFLSISGALAIQSNRPPRDWLIARIRRIYPAFWIATIFGFIAANASNYKTFDWYQVLSQLAGTGLLTHQDQLVNVATWFVSLLLILYLITFFVRLIPHQTIIFIALIFCCVFFIFTKFQPLICAHAAAFFVALIFFKLNGITKYLYIIFSLLFTISIINRYFAYPSIALLLTILTLKLPDAPQIVKLVSKYSYEIYLLHGIFIVGSYKIIGEPFLVSIPLGLLSSVIAAVLLQKTVSLFERMCYSSLQ